MTAQALEPGLRKSHRLVTVESAPDADALAEKAVIRAVKLAAAIRDEGLFSVAEATDTLTRQELIALIVTLAAMCPADVDADDALTWIDLPVKDWPDHVVDREATRHDTGATDGTAVIASTERARRRRAVLQSVRLPEALR